MFQALHASIGRAVMCTFVLLLRRLVSSRVAKLRQLSRTRLKTTSETGLNSLVQSLLVTKPTVSQWRQAK